MDRVDDAAEGVRDWLVHVRVDDTLATMPESVVVAIAAAAVALAASRSTWRIVGYPVTIVHELGHVVAALTAGFRLRGVTVNGDMSGATNFWSHSTLGSIWTLWWGYPAPAAVGGALIWAAAHGWSRLALAVLVLCLAFVFLLSRSLLTVGVVVLNAALFGVVGWYGTAWLCTVVVFAFAWLLIVGAVRGLWAVLKTHVTGRDLETSDAYLLGRLTVIPGGLWLLTFAAAIGACGWFGVSAVLDAVA